MFRVNIITNKNDYNTGNLRLPSVLLIYFILIPTYNFRISVII